MMKCSKCGKEIVALVDGKCSDCFHEEMYRLRGAHDRAIEMMEEHVNKDAPHGEPVSEDIFTRGLDKKSRMSMQQFKEGKSSRKMLELALMRMAGIYDGVVQKKIAKDLDWLIDNKIEQFWGKNIRLKTEENVEGYKVLAGVNGTYIVESEE